MPRRHSNASHIMAKSLNFVALAALMLALAACAGDPPRQTADSTVAAPADGNGVYGHWMVPISFPN